MPTEARRRWFHFFQCPSCGFKSVHARKAGKGWRDPLFWCEACGRYSKLQYPGVVGALWGASGGLIAAGIWFGPLHDFYFGEQTLLRFAAPLAGALVAVAAWPLFARIFLRYRDSTQEHP